MYWWASHLGRKCVLCFSGFGFGGVAKEPVFGVGGVAKEPVFGFGSKEPQHRTNMTHPVWFAELLFLRRLLS